TDGHGADAWGLVLIALGVLLALGTYVGLAGAAGRALDGAVGAAVGVLRYLVPPAIILIGVAFVRGPQDTTEIRADRTIIGPLLLLLSVCGLLHLLGDQPAWTDGDALREAGGFIGAGLAIPLEALMAVPGAALVLSVVLVFGVLLVAETTVRTVARVSVSILRPGWAGLTRALQSLFMLPEDQRPARDAAEPAPEGPRVLVDGRPIGETPDRDDGPGPASPDPSAEIDLRDASAEEKKAAPKKNKKKAAGADATAEIDLQSGLDAAPTPVGPYILPSLSLLERSQTRDVDSASVEAAGHQVVRALAEHKVETRLVGAIVGPTVTRYELELGPGVKVAKVTSLHRDIAYTMAAPDVRILAPIPGKQAIGVEVPNVSRDLVALGDILGSEEARTATEPLQVATGRDIHGRSVMMDLAQMPHMLIAGATGAGKSSCINSLLTSILMRSTPDEVRLILVDPKRVELGQYNGLPHLLTQVVDKPKNAANALAWAVREMEKRYDLLAEAGFRDMKGYNEAVDSGELAKRLAKTITAEDKPEPVRLPYILIVIDELNDLMMVAARDVEESICRIAQMARAVGIHLVIATQRPSVNVITGVIKANIPARLAFAVSSAQDSRVILDQIGAEKLVGKGDMLLMDGKSNVPLRLQGCWVTEDEVRHVVKAWKQQAPEVVYDDAVQEAAEGAPAAGGSAGGSGGVGDDDDLLGQAMELVVRSQLGSTSMLQRKLRVGFARAGRIMDLLEQQGVVGPSEGSKAREVLMTVEELEGGTAPEPDGPEAS
ncbi:MAG: DNA translocase FtsK, partial [Acidimicrobiales bacterium]